MTCRYTLICFSVVLLLMAGTAFCADKQDVANSSMLDRLQAALKDKNRYQQLKVRKIDSLKKELDFNSKSVVERFSKTRDIVQEYKSYNFDTAFSYSLSQYRLAVESHSLQNVLLTKLDIADILISAGMYKEAEDTLSSIPFNLLSASRYDYYYSVMSRLSYDLAEYSQNPHYAAIYTASGLTYTEHLLAMFPPESFMYAINYANKLIHTNQSVEAIRYIESMLLQHKIDDHTRAIIYSMLGKLYQKEGNSSKAVEMFARAAILDVKSAVVEATALRDLSFLLFSKGDTKNAYVLIHQALNDANFYGAKLRKLQVIGILPTIELEKLNDVESKGMAMLYLIVGLAIAIVALALLVMVVLRQIKMLKSTRGELISTLNRLKDVNLQLEQTSKVKDEYVSYYFSISTDYIDKIEAIKRRLQQQLVAKRYDEAKLSLDKVDVKSEREMLLVNFDRTFLKLFPDFLSRFSTDLVKGKDDAEDLHLSMELRIMALIQMGITDNDKISKILNLSIKTVYTYKAKIKGYLS